MFWYLFIATAPVWVGVAVQSVTKRFIGTHNSTKKTYIFLCSLVVFLMICMH